jgi:hypothetical protein
MVDCYAPGSLVHAGASERALDIGPGKPGTVPGPCGARPAFATATNAVHASFFDVARMRRIVATILAVAIAW